jgi:hypothetical protein
MHRLSVQRTILVSAFAAAVCLGPAGCRSVRDAASPAIEFTRIPAAGTGSPDKLEMIAGSVAGARPGDRIVLYAQSVNWWVQPFADKPFTAIQPDAGWKTWTHPGSAYAALLVDSHFQAPPTLTAMPKTGGGVLAVATVAGARAAAPPRPITFSGYQWEIRDSASDRAGSMNFFDPANVRVGKDGSLYLKIAGQPGHWTSAEVRLSRSLGYGTYRFVVRDISHLEPAAVVSFFTWDDIDPARGMNIEISRWGEQGDKNAQYVIQPYFVPANTVRFNAPGGALTHWAVWEPGHAMFRTTRGSSPNMNDNVVAGHVFTSGVPPPGSERIHMNLYVYDSKRNPLRHECEVVIEKFEFRP